MKKSNQDSTVAVIGQPSINKKVNKRFAPVNTSRTVNDALVVRQENKRLEASSDLAWIITGPLMVAGGTTISLGLMNTLSWINSSDWVGLILLSLVTVFPAAVGSREDNLFSFLKENFNYTQKDFNKINKKSHKFKSYFGIPFKTTKIEISNFGVRLARHDLQKVKDGNFLTAKNIANAETHNVRTYLVSSRKGQTVEQIIEPTALTLWDEIAQDNLDINNFATVYMEDLVSETIVLNAISKTKYSSELPPEHLNEVEEMRADISRRRKDAERLELKKKEEHRSFQKRRQENKEMDRQDKAYFKILVDDLHKAKLRENYVNGGD